MSKYENIWNAEATYQYGVEAERERIIKLLEDRLEKAVIFGSQGRVTAYQKDINIDDLEHIVMAIIYAIKEDKNE